MLALPCPAGDRARRRRTPGRPGGRPRRQPAPSPPASAPSCLPQRRSPACPVPGSHAPPRPGHAAPVPLGIAFRFLMRAGTGPLAVIHRSGRPVGPCRAMPCSRRTRGGERIRRWRRRSQQATGSIRLAEPRGRWVLAATVLGSSMAMLDATVVNVALPTIGRELDTSLGRPAVDGHRLHADPGRADPARAARSATGSGGAGSSSSGWSGSRSPPRCAGWPPTSACSSRPGRCRASAARCSPRARWPSSRPRSSPSDRPRAIGAWSGPGRGRRRVGPFLGGWIVGADRLALDLPAQPPARGGRGRRGGAARAGDQGPHGQRPVRRRRRGARRAGPGRHHRRAHRGALRTALPRAAVTGAVGVAAGVAFVLLERRRGRPGRADRAHAAAGHLRLPPVHRRQRGDVPGLRRAGRRCSSCWCSSCRWSPASPRWRRASRCCRRRC